MRYTTIIDIREIPKVYRNKNARLLYLHLVLASGYHNEDRDLVDLSLREMAWQTGLTLSAIRNAIRALQVAHLITKEGDYWRITKFVLAQAIEKRVTTAKKQQEAETRARIDEEAAARERQRAEDRERTERLFAAGKTSFMAYFEEQQKKAAQGDAEALKTITNKRWQTMYKEQSEAMLKREEKV